MAATMPSTSPVAAGAVASLVPTSIAGAVGWAALASVLTGACWVAGKVHSTRRYWQECKADTLATPGLRCPTWVKSGVDGAERPRELEQVQAARPATVHVLAWRTAQRLRATRLRCLVIGARRHVMIHISNSKPADIRHASTSTLMYFA